MPKMLLCLIISVLIAPRFGEACTAIAAGKKATRDGSVIVSQTDSGTDSRLFVVPARRYKAGEKAAVYLDIQDVHRPLHDDGLILGYIPQVEQTYAYIHSAYSHINEHQLAIAESTQSQRPELIVTQKTGKQIMTIEQAMIFALQRHKKARQATAFIGELLERYGFLPSCVDESESLIIGDPDEAWVFEVYSVGPGWTPESGKPGAIWAAQRVPDDQIVIIPNWSIIKEIDPSDKSRFLVSENYRQEAIDRGWFDPAANKPFVWQETYSPLAAEWATSRFWSFFRTFAPRAVTLPDRSIAGNPYRGLSQYTQTVEPLSLYPFSVKPDQAVSVSDIIAFQRSVHEGSIYDMSEDPAWYVHDGKGGLEKSPLATPFPGSHLRKLLRITYRRPVARHRGEYGMVAQLRGWLPDAIGGVYYAYLDNPYFSPYMPIHCGNISIHPAYAEYDPEHYSESSARWAVDFVDNLANLCFQKASRDIIAKRDAFDAATMEKMAGLEAEAIRLHSKDPLKARQLLTRFSNERMAEMVGLYRELRNELIVKYSNNRE